MRVSHHKESVLDTAVFAELTDLTSNLYPDTPEIKSVLSEYKVQVERICGIIDIVQYSSLLDLIMILIEGLEQLGSVDRNLTASEYIILHKVPKILSEYLDIPTDKKVEERLLDLLKDPLWIRPITKDEEKELFAFSKVNQDHSMSRDAVQLDELLNSYEETETCNVVEALQGNPSINGDELMQLDCAFEDSEAISNINPELQELINLIKTELSEIIESHVTLENDLSEGDQHKCANTLSNMADQAINISNAVRMMGLEGLSQCGKFISENISQLMLSIDDLDSEKVTLLVKWPHVFLGYINNFNDVNTISAILSLMTNDSWSQNLDIHEYEELKKRLENPVFIEEDKEARQQIAVVEDIDLSLPDDVNHELLEGLLLDLPAQTEEFSNAIQNLSSGGGMEHIETAQRIAHTLKGAANVVGVSGIANLTHHLEDILQFQSKANTLPAGPLIEVLIRASDCLESMAETLLGIDTQPDDALNVLQNILDWANRLDNVDVPPKSIVNDRIHEDSSAIDESLTDDLPKHQETSETAIVKQNDNTKVLSENILRIPVSLADDMLRLAGENLIYTSQIQEYINVLEKKQDSIDLHNQSLLQLSYDLERLIDIQGFMPGVSANDNDAVFDPLELDQYHEVHTISRRLVEIAADSVELSQEIDKELSGLNEIVVNQNQLQKEGEELVLRTRMVPVKTIIPRLKRGVRQISRLTGKNVEINVGDNNTLMDGEVLNNMIEPLMHILRNAIDHGIELEHERLSKGKAPCGTIHLSFERKGDQVIINVTDDGRGLDTDEIYSKAISNGFINEEEDLSIENIQRLILEPGITTRNKVTQVSGRGIGLDVVSVKVRELKGSIDISSSLDEGCSLTMSIPVSSFSTHSLLVRSRQYIYAISSHGVEEIIYPGIGDIRDVGEQTIYQLENEAYSAVLLDELLNLPPDRRKNERNVRPILLVKNASGSKTAILVQEVIDSRDIVVKNMGSYIPKLKGIMGATVLGDGSVSPVIDLPEILHERSIIQNRPKNQEISISSQVQSQNLRSILVVDDSLSARRSLAQFVEDMGIAVRTARDGIEAISIIETSKPDLLLVDMEMPKMNGLELTSHIRATPEINDIPIIMVTSRSTVKHRDTAISKGVNHYMVKPFDEEELAQHINSMLEAQ